MDHLSPTVGGWKQLQILGNGSFGQLSLWKELATDKLVAVKVCRRAASDLNDKIKLYWDKEVEIMYKLNHPNVVKAVPVPMEVAKCLNSELPALGLEYCTGGDLRRLLTRTENLCGLSEKDVRHILHDICQGLTYLHNERIIHRDIKPDNIVISEGGPSNRSIYKIIDLGYAKRLQQNSIAQSFVGTLVYLAPELFEQKAYNYTVDYWSLGVLAFEIVSGIRPFFHSQSPLEWIPIIKHKKDEVIFASKGPNGNEFSTLLPDWCQLSEHFKADFIVWLRVMLAYDPKNRCPDTQHNSLEVMLAILKRRVVDVYNVNSQKVLSFSENSSPDDLYTSSMISVSNQLLLSAEGSAISFEALKSAGISRNEDASTPAYLFHLNGSYALSANGLPTRVKLALARNPGSSPMPYPEQKRLWQHMYHYVHLEFLNCCRTLSAYRCLLVYLNSVHNEFSAKLNNVSSTYKEVKVLAQTIREAEDYGRAQIKKYKHSAFGALYAIADSDSGSLCLVNDIKSRMREIVARANSLHKKLVKLRENSFGRSKPPDVLAALHDAVLETLKGLRERNSVERRKDKSNVDMVRAVQEFNDQHNWILKEVSGHILDALSHIKDLREALSQADALLLEVTKEQAKLKLQHQSYYTALWNVIKKLMVEDRNGSSCSSMDMQHLGRFLDDTCKESSNDGDSNTRVADIDSIVRENESYRSQLDSLNLLMESDCGSLLAHQDDNADLNRGFASFL